MTTEELNTIVQAVIDKINNQVIDFDVAQSTPESTDLLSAVRSQNDGTYQGVTLKWDDVANAVTREAKGYRDEAASAKTNVENMKASVDQTVSDFNTLAEQKKAEVQGVYQTDLNGLKGDIDTERNARIEADTAHSTRLQKNRYEIDNLKAKAEGKLYRTETVEVEAYTVDVPSSVAPYAEVQKIGGKSVVWNQLVTSGAFTNREINGLSVVNNGDGSISINGTATAYTELYAVGNIDSIKQIPVGHKLFITIAPQNKIAVLCYTKTYGGTGINAREDSIQTVEASIQFLKLDVSSGTEFINEKITVKIFDITQMFGSGNEPTLEECKKIFSADYYPYDAGTIRSFPVKTVKSVGKNLCLAKDVYAGAVDYLETTLDGKDCVRFTSGGTVKNKLIEFKENTQYTVSFDLKMVKKISSDLGEVVFTFFYTDGSKSSIYGHLTDFTVWKRVTKSSDANKTVSFLGLDVYNYETYCYVSNFQLEEGTVATDFAPYREPVLLDVSSVTSDLKSAGSVHDEWSNGKKIIRVGERAYTSGDESESGYITDGTTTYYPLDTPTEETVPEIDNYINVEGGGTLTFESDDAVHMPVPNKDRFVVDLTSITEEEIT